MVLLVFTQSAVPLTPLTPLPPPLAHILPQNRFPVNPWFTMNHGYKPIYMFVTDSLRKLCVSYRPSLSGIQMFNANGKFANIVVWQRKPLCAPVLRSSCRHRIVLLFSKVRTNLTALCRKSSDKLSGSQLPLIIPVYRVNHTVENHAG